MPSWAREVMFLWVISVFWKMILPLSDCSMPMMILARVVLPLPFGPVRAMSLPLGILRLMSQRICFSALVLLLAL